MKWPDAIRYWIAQLLGGTAAALICLSLFDRDIVVTCTPQLGTNLTPGQGILVEAILTFFLVFVCTGRALTNAAGALQVWRLAPPSRSTFCSAAD